MNRIVSLLLLGIVFAVNAKQITFEQAQTVANELFGQTVNPVKKHKTLRTPSSGIENDYNPYYIFNISNNNGFVIIAGDDRVQKIIGYSESGSFDYNNIAPQLSGLLSQYEKKLSEIPESAQTNTSWTSQIPSSDSRLLETAPWGQEFPYNTECPMIDGIHAKTGCITTAMAIIMKYNEWPSNYDWSSMPLQPTSENKQLANLFSEIGKSLDMSYGLDESSANKEDVRFAFTEKFGYSNSIEYLQQKYFEYSIMSYNECLSIIKNQIDKNQPCLFVGDDGSTGHMFVCDGYQGDLIHINWGWDGINNGYFSLSLDNEEIIWKNNQALISEIKKDDGIWSRAYIDSSVNYDRRMGCGLNMRNINVNAGDELEFVVSSIGTPMDFNGEITLALVDLNGNIKELIEDDESSLIVNDETRLQYNYNDKHHRYSWSSLHHNFHFDIQPLSTDRICVVSKEKGETTWKFVPGTATATSWVPVVGNSPKTIKVNIQAAPDVRIATTPTLPEDCTVLVGQNFGISACSTVGIPSLNLNGYQTIFICPGNGYETTTGELVAGVNEMGMFGVDEINISASIFRYEDMEDFTITIDEGCSIIDNLNGVNLQNVGNLTIIGNLTEEDYAWIIKEMPNLSHLNISETNLKLIKSAPTWLQSFKLPNDLEEIGPYAFTGAGTLLKGIVLPSSLQKINPNAFFQAGVQLSNIICLSAEPAECEATSFSEFSNLYFGQNIKPVLYVPKGSLEKYKSTSGWDSFEWIVEYSCDTPQIKTVTIDGYETLLVADKARITNYPYSNKTLDIPSSFNYNGNDYEVFTVEAHLEYRYDLKYEYSTINSIIVPHTVKVIGKNCFDLLQGLKRIEFSEGLEKIEYDAVRDCYNLEEIHIPASIKSIGQGAFRSNHSLNKVFYNCQAPISTDEVLFDDEAYNNATLCIPKGCEDIFKSTHPWNNFIKIEPTDTGLGFIEIDENNQASDIFTLSGIRVDKNTKLPTGIYIVRHGTMVHKIVVD